MADNSKEVSKFRLSLPTKATFSPNEQITVAIEMDELPAGHTFKWTAKGCTIERSSDEEAEITLPEAEGEVKIEARMCCGGKQIGKYQAVTVMVQSSRTPISAIDNLTERITSGGSGIQLQSKSADLTPNKALYVHIKESTDAIAFKAFKLHADTVMCNATERGGSGQTALRYIGENAFEQLWKCTNDFLKNNVGCDQFLFDQPPLQGLKNEQIDNAQSRLRKLSSDDEGARQELTDNSQRLLKDVPPAMLPYSAAVYRNRDELPLKGAGADNCTGILEIKLTRPLMVELIWSYWMEEGMLVQALNAILTRFQNRNVPGMRGGLNHLNLSPLRPLSNLLWGYIQNPNRPLSVRRRAMEYLHEYGFKLKGKVVGDEEPVETRTTFIRAFHSLLNTVSGYYRELADTTRIPSAFSVLNSLREVHMVLAEGAHNQYGDMPYAARRDMLIQSWILARPEVRDFLRGRDMVPYPEAWMQPVDQLKTAAGWSPVSVRHFYDLATFGERLLLSARFTDWSNIHDENEAAQWAEYFRSEVQGYIHAYKTVTNVDLGAQGVANQKEIEQKWGQSPSDLIITAAIRPAE